MNWNILGKFITAAFCIFAGLSLSGLIYVLASNSKKIKTDKQAFFWFIFGILAIGELTVSAGYAILEFYNAFYSIHHVSSEAAAELTGAVITVATIISTVFGLLFKNRQDKIQKLHSESGWRKELLKLESNTSYTINDLFKLNTFINPYHTHNNNIDYLVNFAIITIINNHTKNSDWVDKNFKRFFALVNQSSIDKKIKNILLPNYSLSNLFDIEFQEKLRSILPNRNSRTSTIEQSNDDSKTEKEDNENLTDTENAIIHKCIHALLKNDWE